MPRLVITHVCVCVCVCAYMQVLVHTQPDEAQRVLRQLILNVAQQQRGWSNRHGPALEQVVVRGNCPARARE